MRCRWPDARTRTAATPGSSAGWARAAYSTTRSSRSGWWVRLGSRVSPSLTLTLILTLTLSPILTLTPILTLALTLPLALALALAQTLTLTLILTLTRWVRRWRVTRRPSPRLCVAASGRTCWPAGWLGCTQAKSCNSEQSSLRSILHLFATIAQWSALTPCPDTSAPSPTQAPVCPSTARRHVPATHRAVQQAVPRP